jgi:hypothetical protein
MPSVKATVEIPVETSVVYRYLRGRYQSENFQSATMAAKGYTPAVGKLQDIEDEFLQFRVAGRDALTKISLSSWTWSYDLKPTRAGRTKVTIEYQWSWVVSFLSAGTAGHQAGNELAETVLALDALHFERN